MKYAHTLNVNAKEIEILNEALRMYRAHLDKIAETKEEKNLLPLMPASAFTASRARFHSYRAKVISMSNVMDAVKNSAKPVVSEASEFTPKEL